MATCVRLAALLPGPPINAQNPNQLESIANHFCLQWLPVLRIGSILVLSAVFSFSTPSSVSSRSTRLVPSSMSSRSKPTPDHQFNW